MTFTSIENPHLIENSSKTTYQMLKLKNFVVYKKSDSHFDREASNILLWFILQLLPLYQHHCVKISQNQNWSKIFHTVFFDLWGTKWTVQKWFHYLSKYISETKKSYHRSICPNGFVRYTTSNTLSSPCEFSTFSKDKCFKFKRIYMVVKD